MNFPKELSPTSQLILLLSASAAEKIPEEEKINGTQKMWDQKRCYETCDTLMNKL